MKKISVNPREAQLVELTRGITLPCPEVHKKHFLVIVETVEKAWSDLITKHSESISIANEAEVNALMEARLNRLILDGGRWAQLVSNVARGKESVSFDGKRLENRPDLSIYLTRGNPIFPLVVECKIIDIPKSKTISMYCENGISRFIDGQYAWGSREALMLAYCRDGSTANSELKTYINRNSKYTPVDISVISDNSSDTLQTKYNRSFIYSMIGSNSSPGPITLWHIWLSCPSL